MYLTGVMVNIMLALSSSGSRQLMSARNRPIESANAASEPRRRYLEHPVFFLVTPACVYWYDYSEKYIVI